MRVTLYVKSDCHLCDDARDRLHQLQPRWPHTLELVDITSDPALFERYRYSIPVLCVGKATYPAPLTADVLARALAKGDSA